MQEISLYNIAVTGTQKWIDRLHVDLLDTAATILNYAQLLSSLHRCLIHKLPALFHLGDETVTCITVYRYILQPYCVKYGEVTGSPW